MRYFSMFSGIGGFELGIQRAFNKQLTEIEQDRQGGNRSSDEVEHDVLPTSRTTPLCVGYSEIDKYAIKVYERNFNGNKEVGATVQRSERSSLQQSRDKSYSQVRSDSQSKTWGDREQQLTQDNNRGEHRNYGDATTINPTDLPDFDLLVGGFPCQAFSIAGKRQGFNDTRGTLFFDIARILAEKRPRHLVLENVKGLLSHEQGKTFQTILGVLSDLGYRVEWQVLNSKDFGVPQNRERIYFVGHLRGECSGQVFPIIGTSGKAIKTIGQVNNAQSGKVYSTDGVSTTLAANGGGNGAKTGLYKTGTNIRRLTPLECERLQGFPDNWTALGIGEEPISDTQRYKMAGNAVTVNTVQAVMEGLINEH